MKLSHALILASSLAFFACGDDDDSPTGANAGYDCTVSDGVKVVYPAGGETFKVGDEITVIFGTTVDETHGFAFKKDDKERGYDLFDESIYLTAPADGKTCHTVKVKLDAERGVEPTLTGIIRVYPYQHSSKGGYSKPFTVKE